MPPADPSKHRLPRSAFHMTMYQSPTVGKAMGSRLSDRRPLDPPPVIKIDINDQNDGPRYWLQNPYYFCVAALWDPAEDKPATYGGQVSPLGGTLAASLQKLKDTDNRDGGFFIFGDICVRLEGEFRLMIALYEVLEGQVVCLSSITSDIFKVHTSKTFPGLNESTYISRNFSDQGVRIRVRKEGRISSKRSARLQGINEEESYDGGRADQSPLIPQASTYTDISYTARNDYGQNRLKRPRMSADIGEGPAMRDSWMFSSGGPTSSIVGQQMGYSGYQSMIPQSFSTASQSFSTGSQAYAPTTTAYPNLMSYPRTAQSNYWPGQTRTNTLNMSYPMYPEDPVRQN